MVAWIWTQLRGLNWEVLIQAPCDSVTLWDPSRHSSMWLHLRWQHYWLSDKWCHLLSHLSPSGGWAYLACKSWRSHKGFASGAPLLSVDTSAQWHSGRGSQRPCNWCALFCLIFGLRLFDPAIILFWSLHLKSKEERSEVLKLFCVLILYMNGTTGQERSWLTNPSQSHKKNPWSYHFQWLVRIDSTREHEQDLGYGGLSCSEEEGQGRKACFRAN